MAKGKKKKTKPIISTPPTPSVTSSAPSVAPSSARANRTSAFARRFQLRDTLDQFFLPDDLPTTPKSPRSLNTATSDTQSQKIDSPTLNRVVRNTKSSNFTPVSSPGTASLTQPFNSPILSTKSARAHHILNAEKEISRLKGHFDEDDRDNEYGTPSLLGLPRKVQRMIWKKVLIQEETVIVCGCGFCENIGKIYLPITQTCYYIRSETLPMFYRDNRFLVPIGHDAVKAIHEWLFAIGKRSRKTIRHLEIPTTDIIDTLDRLRDKSHMELATNIATRSSAAWHGQDVDVFWLIFRSKMADIDREDCAESDVESISSSILSLPSEKSFFDDDDAEILSARRVTITRNPLVKKVDIRAQKLKDIDQTIADIAGDSIQRWSITQPRLVSTHPPLGPPPSKLPPPPKTLPPSKRA